MELFLSKGIIMELKKLTSKQKVIVDKIIDSNLLDEKELKVFYSLFSKRNPEAIKAAQQDWDLAAKMWDALKAGNPSLNKPNMLRWANTIYRIRITDRIGFDVLFTLIDMVYADSFWSTKITNPNDLRRHANRLIIQFKIQKSIKADSMFIPFEPEPKKAKINYGAYEDMYVR
jgi:hypothetical protein